MASRALIIYNPVAARSRQASLDVAEKVLRRAGWKVETAATEGPEDPRRLAAEGRVAGVDVVAVLGGDGTTVRAAAALVGSEIPLALLPTGTGNLLAGNLRIPRATNLAAELIVQGRSRRIDLGKMERDQGTVYFCVACGTGIDAEVMRHTDAEQKRRWGIGAYISTTLRLLPSLRSHRHVVTVDGVETVFDAAMVLVMNCREVIPPHVRFKHAIFPDDGLLDVVAVRADTMIEGFRAVWQAVRNDPTDDDGSLIRYARGRVVTVETDAPLAVEMDGDPDGETPFTVEVVPGAVAVITPNGGRGNLYE